MAVSDQPHDARGLWQSVIRHVPIGGISVRLAAIDRAMAADAPTADSAIAAAGVRPAAAAPAGASDRPRATPATSATDPARAAPGAAAAAVRRSATVWGGRTGRVGRRHRSGLTRSRRALPDSGAVPADLRRSLRPRDVDKGVFDD